MASNRCKVCGGAEMNLVAGFYYCVECGTQEENVQEHLVENVVLADGTMARFTTKKIQSKTDMVEMSAEWYKWHAYNYIIAGLTDELIAAGAKPSVRTKILWIWTKYIKKFQIKDSGPVSEFYTNEEKEKLQSYPQDQNSLLNDSVNNTSLSPDHNDLQKEDKLLNDKYSFNHSKLECTSHSVGYDMDNDDELFNESDSESLSDSDEDTSVENDKIRLAKDRNQLSFFRKSVIIAIFYIALNLDKSDILLSHLRRFVKWGYINFLGCTKYIPKDLDKKKIPLFGKFTRTLKLEFSIKRICIIVCTLMRYLDLGVPIIPNLTTIVSDAVKELCLPNDFLDLVESLMYKYPSHYFKTLDLRKALHIPDYETICMGYIMVALKMCFGLDNDYDIRLSEVVNRKNEENNYHKSYKFGENSDSTERLFSFSEWCGYLRTRKMIVCKHNLLMANLFKVDIDDYVFLEHLEERQKIPMSLSQEITMDILNKIPLENKVSVIPKTEFDLTFTPITAALDVICEYIQDPDLRLILTEDFTQYSLDYAIKSLELKDEGENIIQGVSEDDKIINKEGHETSRTFFSYRRTDMSSDVFVRFYENEDCDKDSTSIDEKNNANNDSKIDLLKSGYESDVDEANSSKVVFSNERTIKFVDYPNACIYDDDDKTEVQQAIEQLCESDNKSILDESIENDHESLPLENSMTSDEILPPDFDRRKIIDELIKIACKKYKLRLPTEKKNVVRQPRGKTQNLKYQRRKNKEECAGYNLLTMYYRYLQKKEQNNNSNNNATEDIDQNNSMINNDDAQENPINQPTEVINNLDQSEAVNTSEPEIIEESDVEEESILKDDDGDEEYTFPPITEDLLDDEESITQLNKAVNKILSKETKYSDEPPKKKLKKTPKEKKKFSNRNRLVDKKRDLRKFNYWIAHYNYLRLDNLHLPFNIELYEHLPHSFRFVLYQCAMVIDCCPSLLYKAMQHIEKYMFADVQT